MSMRQKLYDLKEQKSGLVAECAKLLEAGKVDAWEQKHGELKELKTQIDAIETQLMEEEGIQDAPGSTKQPGLGKKHNPDADDESIKAFAAEARRGFKAAGDQLQEGENEDGGYTVPQDITTRVIKLRESKESLLDEVTVIPVKTNAGRRTVKRRGKHAGFHTVAEAAKIPKIDGPKFDIINYTIAKRSGYMLVTEELLADSDTNISNVAVEWLADEGRATGNVQVVTAIKKNASTDLKDLDGIIKAWVKLGSSIRTSAKLITNDDGLAWLSTLKDQNGRYLLSPNPSDPAKLQLCVGPHIIPIKTYDNDVLANDSTKVPMIVGDLKQGIIYWDRQQLSIRQSKDATVGGVNCYEQDMVAWKGTLRDDCTQLDKAAYVNGYVDTAAVAGV